MGSVHNAWEVGLLASRGMAVDPALADRTFPPTPAYEVSREKIAEFAGATGSEYDGGPAPATFPIVVAFAAMNALIADPGTGIALHRVVHGEQRFTHTRPVRAGDRLTATLTVDSLRAIRGTDIIGTRTEITDGDDEHVCTAYATLVHRAEES